MKNLHANHASALGAALAFSLVCLLSLEGAFAASPPEIAAGQDYGAGLTLATVSPLPAVLAAAERHTEQPVLVYGRISDVCQKKGCWTVLSDRDANVRVRFKDYGFFLPKDSSGKYAYVEGVVKIEMQSEKVAKHYASESQHGDPDAIRGPRREVGFVATGVRLVEEN